MEKNNDSNQNLVPFLRNLADSIEKQQLLPRQLQSIGEFFMKYQFQQQAIKDNDNSYPPPTEFSNEELIKFIVLGWYIYCCILKNNSIPNYDDDVD